MINKRIKGAGARRSFSSVIPDSFLDEPRKDWERRGRFKKTWAMNE